MQVMRTTFLLLLFIVAFHRCISVENVKVTRWIDVRSPAVRLEHEITASKIGKSYQFSIHPAEVPHVAHIDAELGTKKPLTLSSLTEKPGFYTIDFTNEPSDPVTFKVNIVLTNVLEPKPQELQQNDKQYIKYTGNVMFFSPYYSAHQETHIILPNGEILRYTSAPEPITRQTKKLLYGPYFKVDPFSYIPLHVHFENNRPFMVIKRMTRLIEISHWGNIAVEESIEIRNEGAKLRGPFSRLDFDMGHGQRNAAMSFKTALPAAAKDIYYRDEIGNISTSSVLELIDTVEVSLSPRFPLMGGWKTQYILGYNVPAHEFLYRTGTLFTLRMRFLDHVHDDQIVEDLTVKIVLPEMVTHLDFRAPYPVDEQPREVVKTYLDTFGRTVLVFKARNLVTEHIKDFTLNYRFNMLYMLREPLMLITAFCVIFLCVVIYVRLDFSIHHDEKIDLRLRVQALVDDVQSVYKQRALLYQSYEEILNEYKSKKDHSVFNNSRRKLESEHKRLNQSLSALQMKFVDLYSEGVDKIKELLTLDSTYRDLIQESVQLAERLINGKLAKQQYQSSEVDVSTKRSELLARMNAVMESI